MAAAADEVTIEAVHDPGFLDHLLEADETLWVGHLPFTGLKPPRSLKILLRCAHRNEWLGILALLATLWLYSMSLHQSSEVLNLLLLNNHFESLVLKLRSAMSICDHNQI